MIPRIAWSPDGNRVLVCDQRSLRIAKLDGPTIRELEPRTIELGEAPRDGVAPHSELTATFSDARWLRDGRIVAVDICGLAVQFTMQGAPYADPKLPPNPWRVDFAVLAEGGDAAVTYDGHALIVYGTTVDHIHRWRLNTEREFRLPFDRLTAAMSYGGDLIVITYWTQAISAQQPSGFGWCLLDISSETIKRSRWRKASLLDRDWLHGGTSAPRFAFDRRDRRMAIASQTRFGSGAIRIGGPLEDFGHPRLTAEVEPRSQEHAGARLVALDDHGLRSAYAFTTDRELRIDYLAPHATGPRSIAILDSQRIDPGFEVVAFAFDEAGHRLACLGADGAIEIVPVP